jgi:uridylate kinase
MTHRFDKTIVIALGGSILFPENVDIKLLKDFRSFIMGWRKRKQFVIVIGGGRPSRIYNDIASRIVHVSDEDKDWLGIHVTRANSQLLRTIFCDVADPVVIDSEEKAKRLSIRGGSVFGGKYPVTIGSGWRPGWSTDYVAFAIAKKLGVREVVVAGKPAYVFDKDFTKHKNAKPLAEISWKDYRKLIPSKWKPGAHAPVDPIAARLAVASKIKGIVLNGKNLKNLDKLLKGEEFRGTIIQ